MTPGQDARIIAQQALGETLRRRRPLDAALDECLANSTLPPRDSGFARAIANETMRRFGQLDNLVRRFVPKTPPPHRAGTTLEILLAGACELLFLDVAAHAAVDAANRLAARDSKAVHFKPLINATLRRVAKEGRDVVAAQDAERLNTPDWLWTRWCSAYGEAATREIARVHATPAPLDIVMKNSVLLPFTGGVPPEAARVGSVTMPPSNPAFVRASPMNGVGKDLRHFALPGGVTRLSEQGAVDTLPGFEQGNWWVQDFAASLPVRLLGDVQGKTVLDLCAAPGGKTAQLAAMGAHVTAVERDATRLARLTENLKRLALEATPVEADIRDFMPKAPADCVLLDAPCSATGTIRRHPELPWIKSAADIMACAQTAAELFDAAAAMVAPGGTLVFAVCSLEDEEGPWQVEDFLRRHVEFRRDPVRADELFGMAELVSADGDLRTLPSYLAPQGGMDGFYAARLKRS